MVRASFELAVIISVELDGMVTDGYGVARNVFSREQYSIRIVLVGLGCRALIVGTALILPAKLERRRHTLTRTTLSLF